MKKIVALVLSLVMVLGLATTAFAADPDLYDVYSANATLAATMATGTGDVANDVAKVEAAAVSYSNGTGSVAYVEIGGVYYTKIAAAKATVNDYVLASKDGKTIVAYLAQLGTDAGNVKYGAKATAFTAFSTAAKCGYVTGTPTAGAVYFQTADGKVYEAAAATTTEADNYLVDGVVYSKGDEQTVVDHSFKATNYKYDTAAGVNVPTSAICTTCLMTSSAIYADNAIPAGKAGYAITDAAGYNVVLGAAVTAPATEEKVESAETFDAGIAMYVGMSVMAAAGSAVVLKKKD